ncbi:hypothetical protein Tco_0755453 [Tanacetum coccineum]
MGGCWILYIGVGTDNGRGSGVRCEWGVVYSLCGIVSYDVWDTKGCDLGCWERMVESLSLSGFTLSTWRKEHGKQLLESVKKGSFQFGTILVPGTATTPATTVERTLDDLTPEEKIHTKELWDRVKLLMEGSELSVQERESKLYYDFNKFTSEKVNTKFVNYLQPKWSKFVADEKLAKDIHNSNFDHSIPQQQQQQSFTSLQQQQFYSPPLHQQPYQAPVVYQQAYEAHVVHYQSPTVFPQLDSGLAVPKFLPTDDPIESLNKAMAFLSEGHIARQCTKPKRAQNSEWFKENMLLAQAQEAGVALDEEQRAFLVDTGKRVDSCPDAQALTTTTIFQTDDLDAFDYDCDEAPTASAVFMANLFAYESDVLSEVQNYDTYQDNNVIDQEMHYSEQPIFINDLNIEITSDSNVISYDQYLK